MDSTEAPILERRIRAAMTLADLDFDELAARIDVEGLGARTLRSMADPKDRRQGRPHELRLIADACSVPYWFLAEGFSGSESGGEESDREIQERLDAVAVLLPLLLERLQALDDHQLDPFVAEALERVRGKTG